MPSPKGYQATQYQKGYRVGYDVANTTMEEGSQRNASQPMDRAREYAPCIQLVAHGGVDNLNDPYCKYEADEKGKT